MAAAPNPPPSCASSPMTTVPSPRSQPLTALPLPRRPQRSCSTRDAKGETPVPTFKRADQEQMEKAKDLLEAAPQAPLGFVKSLFFGRVELDKVLPYPRPDPAEAQ